jgi:hypothetical protein
MIFSVIIHNADEPNLKIIKNLYTFCFSKVLTQLYEGQTGLGMSDVVISSLTDNGHFAL